MSPTTTRVALRCRALLSNPRFNKGTAFTEAERHAFGLVALLPSSINTLESQCDRAYQQLQSNDTDIGKNSFMQSLKDQNWVLHYALLRRHLTELTPIIYTPTEVSQSLFLL
jgi:malate dehydrogenase (oxaloacetate-decarboxylating)